MSEAQSEPHRGEAFGAAPVPRYFIFFLGALVALGPLSVDAYLPAMPTMAEEFGVSIVRLNNTVSIYLLGYGIGQFFGGAFSDQIGRKRVGVIGLSLYIATCISIAFAATVDQVQWLRLLQALGAGFSTVIAMAIVRDVYPPLELGRRFATVTMIMLLAPLLAPALGAFLLRYSWHAIFFVKACYAALLLAFYAAVVPETRPGHWLNLSVGSIFLQCWRVVTRRIEGRRLPLRYALSMALCAGVLMIFLTNASFLYIQHFDIAPTRFPLFFGLSVIGLMSMNLFSMRRLDRHNAGTLFRRGLLIQVSAVSVLLLVVLLGLDSLWTVIPPLVIAISMLGLVNPSGSAQYMGFFDKLAGSASSVYTTLLFAGGGALGALTGAFFNGTLLPIAAVMLAASLSANLLAASLPHAVDANHELR
jgi:DHA1 family bicyclomycin/chloramphenicol resistance-like MFS transporter